MSARAYAKRISDAATSRALTEVIEISGEGARLDQELPTRLSPRKRCFDFALASVVLLALAPALGMVWLLVRLNSPGPGIFWSERVGFRGRPFMMPKFRTMRADAPVVAREALLNAVGCITPLGRVLRRWSIDELPQLICVLRGDMSFVGPRPLIASDPAQAARKQFPELLAVRPGLSGLSQIRGRNLMTPRRKARLDAHYVRTRSWRLDLAIISRTIGVLLTGRGFL